MEFVPVALAVGASLKKGQFVSFAMKIRLNDGAEKVFYLGFDRVVELTRALAAKTQQLHTKGDFSTESSSQATLETENNYRKQDIRLTKDEVEDPDVNNVVHQLNAFVLDESLLLNIIKHDKTEIDISVPDAAIEIFLGYMMNTLLTSGGEELVSKVIAEIEK
ncbi:YjeJ family protein [Pantoea deleyi]|uniref:YjeJ family protein n=1 Tax=Pantoea deleyi TaxID=470932 RepID=UPI0035D3F6DE